MGWFRGRKTKKRHEALADEEQLARLEKAERDVRHLKYRADNAVRTLDSRDGRNHWRESVENMIWGAF